MKIEVTESFLKSAKKLAKRYRSFNQDYHNLINNLEGNPQLGIDLGGGLRKIRMAITSKGKGKSGGARVITFHTIEKGDVLYLVFAYDKSDYDNILLPILKELIKDLSLD